MEIFLKSQNFASRLEREYGKILGICLNSTSRPQVLRFVRNKVAGFKKSTENYKKFFIVTPNPEIILIAQKDQTLSKILNSADLSLPDGIGLASAARLMNLEFPRNKYWRILAILFSWLKSFYFMPFISEKLEKELVIIKGREVFLDLVKLANKKKWKVFLLGGRDGVSQKAAGILEKSLKSVNFGFSDGPELDNQGKPVSQAQNENEGQILTQINEFKPEILFVGFGAPKQEKWVWRSLPKLNIGGAMVVGRTFEFVAGRASVAPRWISKNSLEWLWRLMTGSTNLRRIFSALLVFPLQVYLSKVKSD